MPPRTIPPRQPIGDRIFGAVVREAGVDLLLVGGEASDPPDVIVRGELTIRYGLRYLDKPRLSVVPGLVAIDYGTMLTGEEAWQFLLTRSNLYPRAEVFGARSDGRDEMVYVRQLDLAQPPEVLVHANAESAMPIAFPLAIVTPDPAALPERLTAILPTFPTIAAWRTSI